MQRVSEGETLAEREERGLTGCLFDQLAFKKHKVIERILVGKVFFFFLVNGGLIQGDTSNWPAPDKVGTGGVSTRDPWCCRTHAKDCFCPFQKRQD